MQILTPTANNNQQQQQGLVTMQIQQQQQQVVAVRSHMTCVWWGPAWWEQHWSPFCVSAADTAVSAAAVDDDGGCSVQGSASVAS